MDNDTKQLIADLQSVVWFVQAREIASFFTDARIVRP